MHKRQCQPNTKKCGIKEDFNQNDDRIISRKLEKNTKHYVNVSVLLKISQKTSDFTFIIVSFSINSYVLDVYVLESKYEFVENIENNPFLFFRFRPQIPFLLYVCRKSGVTFVRRRFRDGFLQILISNICVFTTRTDRLKIRSAYTVF